MPRPSVVISVREVILNAVVKAKATHACMTGCDSVLECFRGWNGELLAAPVSLIETIGLCGWNFEDRLAG